MLCMQAVTCYLDHHIFFKQSAHEFGVLSTVAVIKITKFIGKAPKNRCVFMTENEHSYGAPFQSIFKQP